MRGALLAVVALGVCALSSLPARAFLGGEELVLVPAAVPSPLDLSYGRFGAGDLYFDGPVDVATDDYDRAYILDAGNHRVQVADEKGDFVAKWSVGSPQGPPEEEPTALALDRGKKTIFILQRKRRLVLRYTLEGRLLATFGKEGLRPGFLDDPVDLAVDGFGMVYVLDRGRKKVLQFTPEGTFRREFGEEMGLREGLADPVSLACIETTIGFVVVLDAGSSTLVRYDRDGAFRDRTPLPPELTRDGRLTRLRSDRENGLFVLDAKDGKLIKSQGGSFSAFTLRGEKAPLEEPGSMAVDGKGRLYATDLRKNRVHRFLLDQP